MTARDEVVAALAALPDLPAGIRVMPYARALTNLSQTVAMVRVDRVERGAVAGTRAYAMAVVVVSPKTEPGPADDELDGALEDVLHALETGNTGFLIGTATRAVFGDSQWPAYEIALTVHTQKETTP